MNIYYNILYQDNISAMRTEESENILYQAHHAHQAHKKQLLIHHRQSEDRRSIHHVLPNQEMIANFFTKSLAGALVFKKFRDTILGIDDGDMSEYK